MTRAKTALVLAGMFAVSACHNYTPVENPVPGTIARVVVPLTSAVADRNAPAETVALEGLVLEAGDTIVLATETRRELSAFNQIVQFDTFRVARTGLNSIETREFSQNKSIALGVVITGGAALLALKALGIEGGEAGERNDSDGTNPEGAIVISSSVIGLVWRLLGG